MHGFYRQRGRPVGASQIPGRRSRVGPAPAPAHARRPRHYGRHDQLAARPVLLLRLPVAPLVARRVHPPPLRSDHHLVPDAAQEPHVGPNAFGHHADLGPQPVRALVSLKLPPFIALAPFLSRSPSLRSLAGTCTPPLPPSPRTSVFPPSPPPPSTRSASFRPSRASTRRCRSTAASARRRVWTA